MWWSGWRGCAGVEVASDLWTMDATVTVDLNPVAQREHRHGTVRSDDCFRVVSPGWDDLKFLLVWSSGIFSNCKHDFRIRSPVAECAVVGPVIQ